MAELETTYVDNSSIYNIVDLVLDYASLSINQAAGKDILETSYKNNGGSQAVEYGYDFAIKSLKIRNPLFLYNK